MCLESVSDLLDKRSPSILFPDIASSISSTASFCINTRGSTILGKRFVSTMGRIGIMPGILSEVILGDGVLRSSIIVGFLLESIS